MTSISGNCEEVVCSAFTRMPIGFSALTLRILAQVVCNIPTHFLTEANLLKCLALNPWYKVGLLVIEFAGWER